MDMKAKPDECRLCGNSGELGACNSRIDEHCEKCHSLCYEARPVWIPKVKAKGSPDPVAKIGPNMVPSHCSRSMRTMGVFISHYEGSNPEVTMLVFCCRTCPEKRAMSVDGEVFEVRCDETRVLLNQTSDYTLMSREGV